MKEEREYTKEFIAFWNKREWYLVKTSDKAMAFDWFQKGINSAQDEASSVEDNEVKQENCETCGTDLPYSTTDKCDKCFIEGIRESKAV